VDRDVAEVDRVFRVCNIMSSSQQQGGVYDYDLICIGGGSGGIACAKRAASLHSRKVLCIEKSTRLGGTCVNVGCVPKKVMWSAAQLAHMLKHDVKQYGLSVGGDSSGGEKGSNVKLDYTKLKIARDDYVKRLNEIYLDGFKSAGVSCVLDSTASLVDAHTIKVVSSDNGAAQYFTAAHIVIATGGRPILPPGEGITEHCITSDGFFELTELPSVAVIVGAGYIAVELAGVLNALGSEVHLVLRDSKALRDFDPMIADGLDVEMQRAGIFIHRYTKGVAKVVLDTMTKKKNVTLVCGDTIYGADIVLMAVGRTPNTDEGLLSDELEYKGNTDTLDLEDCGVQLTSNGYVIVDDYQNTTVKGIYALGDVCGHVELTPMAIAAGRRLADRLFSKEDSSSGGEKLLSKVSYDLVPTVVFSHPVRLTD
jgi:glutathione reductase (NADPH)